MRPGIVEAINSERRTVCLHCDDGTYSYYRLGDEGFPGVGHRLEPVDDAARGERAVMNATRGQRVQVLSMIESLPKVAVLALIR